MDMELEAFFGHSQEWPMIINRLFLRMQVWLWFHRSRRFLCLYPRFSFEAFFNIRFKLHEVSSTPVISISGTRFWWRLQLFYLHGCSHEGREWQAVSRYVSFASSGACVAFVPNFLTKTGSSHSISLFLS